MSIRKTTFDKYFEEIKDHCLNGSEISPSSNCGMFIYKLRLYYNEGELDKSFIKRLEEVGFEWQRESLFEKRVSELQEYVREKEQYPPTITRLGSFVSRMRHLKKTGQLSEHKLKKLNSINFKFND